MRCSGFGQKAVSDMSELPLDLYSASFDIFAFYSSKVQPELSAIELDTDPIGSGDSYSIRSTKPKTPNVNRHFLAPTKRIREIIIESQICVHDFAVYSSILVGRKNIKRMFANYDTGLPNPDIEIFHIDSDEGDNRMLKRRMVKRGSYHGH